MRCVNELDLEFADRDNVIRLDAMHQNVVEHIELAQTLFGQCQRKTRRIDRKIEFAKDVREGTDMVFVSVRENDRRQVVTIFFEKVEIRYADINPERRLLRKSHSRVDDDHLVLVANAHAVHAEFADAAERYYFQFCHLFLASITNKFNQRV